MLSITRAEAVQRIKNSGGDVFGVCFVKRTTRESRTMAASINLSGHVKGGRRAYDHAAHGLIPVVDVGLNEIRSVPIEGILTVSFGGECFAIADSADNPA